MASRPGTVGGSAPQYGHEPPMFSPLPPRLAGSMHLSDTTRHVVLATRRLADCAWTLASAPDRRQPPVLPRPAPVAAPVVSTPLRALRASL